MYKWESHDKCYKTDKGDICATEISLPRRTLKKRGYCIKRTKKKQIKVRLKRKEPWFLKRKDNHIEEKIVL